MIKLICTLLFKLSGWKFVNKVPDELRSFVFIGAPHTSNSDIIPALAMSWLMKRNTKFVIKSEWIRFPYSLLFRPIGAIGVDRKKIIKNGSNNTTDVMAQLFTTYKDLVLMIAPEGTRRLSPHWRSGFYYIAQKANVPIVLGFADYAKKEAGLGQVLYPTDYEKDMKSIADFYRDKTGKNTANFQVDQRYA